MTHKFTRMKGVYRKSSSTIRNAGNIEGQLSGAPVGGQYRTPIGTSTKVQSNEQPDNAVAVGWKRIPKGSDRWRSHGRCVGWVKGKHVYLDHEAALAEMQGFANPTLESTVKIDETASDGSIGRFGTGVEPNCEMEEQVFE